MGDTRQQQANIPPDDRFTLANFRNSSLFFPCIFGVIFLILILILAVAIPEPTEFQYQVFRIALALAGSGFATTLTGTLEVTVPILKNGWIKGTTGFAVLIILFFFSPGDLVIDPAKLRAEAYKDEYDNPKSEVYGAHQNLLKGLTRPESAALWTAFGENPSAESRKALKQFVDKLLADRDHGRDFETVERFYKEAITCVENDKCDAPLMCEYFFEEIEDFRWMFCGRLIETALGDRTWERYDEFSIDHCGFQFVKYYVNLRERKFSEICVPTQCWALDVEQPAPCKVKKQADMGALPSQRSG